MALHVQSAGLQLWFLLHGTSSPTNQVVEQEYPHLGGRSTLEGETVKRLVGHN